jgi:hypothetical protein
MEVIAMSRIRLSFLLLLTMLVTFAMGGATSASASTSEWLVNGEPVTSAEEVTSSGGEFVLSSAGKEVKCKKVTDEGKVETSGKDETSEIKFKECAATESGTECSVKSAGSPAKAGEIIVNNTTTELTERFSTEKQETVLADEFKGKTAKENEFVTLEIGKKETSSGNKMTEKCANLPETTKVTGEVAAQVDNTTEELEFPSKELKGNTLKAFGVAAKLTGNVKQRMVGGGALGGLTGTLTPMPNALTFTASPQEMESIVEYTTRFPRITSGTLTVSVTNLTEAGAFKEAAGGTCVNVVLTNTNRCRVKIRFESANVNLNGEATVRGGVGTRSAVIRLRR